MRNIVIFGLCVAIIICSSYIPDSTQDKKEFEGTITYLTVLESKTSNISTDKLQQFYGDTMILHIKDGNYRMAFNGTDIRDIYYVNNTNAQYTLRNGIDTLFVTSCDNDTRQLVSSAFHQDSTKILNRQCRALLNDLGNTKNQYWFDSSIYINPKNFKKHKFGYVNIYYEKAQSPWLKYKYEGTSFNLTHTAIEINERTLSDSIFQLPNLPKGGFE